MSATSPGAPISTGDSPRGFALALGAYGLWGVLPLYFAALAQVPSHEVLAHRVLWSVPVALLILLWLGRTADLRAALRTPRMVGMAMVTAALVSVNWGTYVWAVQTGHVLETALGYYINPLFSILLGALLLGERLSARQWGAVALAACAVAVLTWEAGRLPLVALVLTVTWGFYAYFKRTLPIGPAQGFALEVIVLSPFAAGWLVWLAQQGAAAAPVAGLGTWALLAGTGIITTVPLMLYGAGARLLRLSTIAVMQYVSPTIAMLLAVFVFGEAFEGARVVAFPLIWAALALYSSELWRLRHGAGVAGGPAPRPAAPPRDI